MKWTDEPIVWKWYDDPDWFGSVQIWGDHLKDIKSWPNTVRNKSEALAKAMEVLALKTAEALGNLEKARILRRVAARTKDPEMKANILELSEGRRMLAKIISKGDQRPPPLGSITKH